MKSPLKENDSSSVVSSRQSHYKKAHRALEFEIREEEYKALINELKIAKNALIEENERCKQIEILLRESEETFRTISSSANDAIIMQDDDGKISYWNQAAERMFGYSGEEIVGKKLLAIIPKKLQEAHVNGYKRFKKTGQGAVIGKTVEVPAIRKDGTEFSAALSISAIKLKNRWKAVGILRDITSRKQAEERIHKLSQAVEQSSCGIVITDEKGTIEYVNPKFSRITGYSFEDAVGENPRILKSGKQSPDVFRELWETITSGNEWRGELCNRKKNGNCYWEYESISPVKNDEGVITNYIAVKEDITRRKQIEAELVVSHKMSSIGRLSSSVFHEILNPVNIISSHTQLLLMEVEKGSKTEEDLKSIKSEVERIVDITDKLLKFSNKEGNEVEEVWINDLLENTLSLLMSELNIKRIKPVLKLEKKLPAVMADSDELRQVFLDIITNAIDAMPDGGVLTIRTGSVGSNEPDVSITGEKSSGFNGKCIKISFEDTGCGIAEKNIEMIFEPFFSTKKEIKGVGLSLNSAYAIIENYGGKLSVESGKGKGTTFIIDLPVKD